MDIPVPCAIHPPCLGLVALELVKVMMGNVPFDSDAKAKATSHAAEPIVQTYGPVT